MMYSECPKCGLKYECCCDTCKINYPNKQHFIILQRWDHDNYEVMCPDCGHTAPINFWKSDIHKAPIKPLT